MVKLNLKSALQPHCDFLTKLFCFAGEPDENYKKNVSLSKYIWT